MPKVTVRNLYEHQSGQNTYKDSTVERLEAERPIRKLSPNTSKKQRVWHKVRVKVTLVDLSWCLQQSSCYCKCDWIWKLNRLLEITQLYTLGDYQVGGGSFPVRGFYAAGLRCECGLGQGWKSRRAVCGEC